MDNTNMTFGATPTPTPTPVPEPEPMNTPSFGPAPMNTASFEPAPTSVSGFGPVAESTMPTMETTPAPAPEPVAAPVPEPTPAPAPTPTAAPASAPNGGSNKKLLVIIAILAVVIIGLAVAIIILMQSGKKDDTVQAGETSKTDKGSESGSGSGSGGGSESAGDPAEMAAALAALQRAQRNTQRADDLSRFLTAANSYQSNNNGKTPFYKDSNEINNLFVRRYIDETCSDSPQISKSSSKITYYYYVCDGNEFRDPDGNTYGFAYRGSLDDAETPTKVTTTWETNEHIIHVFTYASCGDNGEVIKGTGERQYAMLYVLEGDGIACNDNH